MKATFLGYMLLCALTVRSYPQGVEPDGSGLVEGNSGSFGPFLNPPRDIPSARYQQVYNFSSTATSLPVSILGITFRNDNQSRSGFSAYPTSFQINLSTTTKAADSLSPVFAENVGADDAIAFGPRSMILGAGFDHSHPPVQSFSINIHFDHPFYFDSHAGNLLIDMRNFSPGPQDPSSGLIDAVDTLGDSVSSLVAFDVNAPSGVLSTKGLVTGFYYQIVPEPSTLTLVGVGLGVLVLVRAGSKGSHRIS